MKKLFALVLALLSVTLMPCPFCGSFSAETVEASPDIDRLSDSDDSITVIDNFVVGGISVSNGSGKVTSNKKRMRTPYLPLSRIRVRWSKKCGYEYMVIFYGFNCELLSTTDKMKKDYCVEFGDVDGAYYVRILLFSKNDFSADFVLPEGCEIISEGSWKTYDDMPRSEGVKNFVLRARECADLNFTAAAVLPSQKEDISPGTELTGILYSSVREESLYVPNCVSIGTYLTALRNPNSYIYTRISSSPNSRTYYGAVCSSYASYCYDLECVYTTIQLGLLNEFEMLDDQSIDNIELGDMLLKEGHVAVITGVTRLEDGRVYAVSVSEAVVPQVRTVLYSRPSFLRVMKKGYVIYRFRCWDRVSPSSSDSNAENNGGILYNPNLCPRRGNWSNWPVGETVEIDVLDPEWYTRAELYRDGVLIESRPIPEDLCIRYEELPCGKYQVTLSDGGRRCEPVSFIVADTHISVKDLGDGTAKISFCSENAKPVWFAWCYYQIEESSFGTADSEMDTDTEDPDEEEEDTESFIEEVGKHHMGVYRAFVLSEEDLERGYTISRVESGVWMFKVEFETEYGVVSSVFAVVTIT